MLVTELKPVEEILEFLEGKENIFLLGCNGCAEVCKTGGEEGLKKIEEELINSGKKISGRLLVEFVCNKFLVKLRLERKRLDLSHSQALLVLSCGIGVQAVSKVADLPVFPAANTLNLGGFQGLWPSEERCQACGDCLLAYTGGICPITACSKSLLNGPCGGATNGKCEVDPEIECGWVKIYNKLKKIGRLDILSHIIPPKDFEKMRPSSQIRKTRFFDIEKETLEERGEEL